MKVMLLIFGMALVTALPRMLPAWLLDRARPTAPIEAWLSHVPYAVLGALIFPGIMSVHPDYPLVGLAAGVAAVIVAWRGLHMLFVIGTAIAVVLLCRHFIG